MGTFFCTYRKSSMKPSGGLIYFEPILARGLKRDGELIWEECFFNLEKTMVSVLHKKTRIQSGWTQVKEGWRTCSWGSESHPNFQLVNKPSRISPHEHKQSWLIIKSIIYLSRIIREGEGWGALIERGGLLTFFPWKGGGGGLLEGGGLFEREVFIEDLRYVKL